MQATETTKTEMVSKLVAAWEDKNAKRAAQGASLSLMALSLAACGGSSDTALNTALTDLQQAQLDLQTALTNGQITQQQYDALTSDLSGLTSVPLTTGDDLIVMLRDATLSGTNLTYTANDVIAGLGGNTLTIATDTSISATPTVTGVANIVINSSAVSAPTFNLGGIANGTVTVNTPANLSTSLIGVTTDSVAHSVTLNGVGNVTVQAGTDVASLTVNMVEDATTVVNTGSAATVVVNATNSVPATPETITVVTAGNVDLTATNAATVNISGTGDVTLNADTETATNITGSAVQTLIVSDSADVSGATVTGFDTVALNMAGTNTAFDARGIEATLAVTDNGLGLVTIASGAQIELSSSNTDILLDINDGDSTVNTLGTANVTLASGGTAQHVITVSDSSTPDHDLIDALNITATGNASLQVVAGQAITVTIGGTGDVAFNAATTDLTTTGNTLDASALTGALTATATANLLAITGGSGDDTITVHASASGLAFDLDGGAGTYDVLVAAADMTAGAFTGFEIVNVSGTTAFTAAQLHNSAIVVNGAQGGSALTVTGTAADTAIDLSHLQFAGTAPTSITTTVSTAAVNITGSSAIDHITGSGLADYIDGGENSDSIVGGLGADTILGGNGDDNLDGGDGADVLTGGLGHDTFVATSTEVAMDRITDFHATAAATNDADYLDVTGTPAALGNATGIAIGSNVLGAVASGVLTLSGTAASGIDTLAEWIDAAELAIATGLAPTASTATASLAFEFNGNTYVVTSTETFVSGGNTNATDSVIELTGLTGVTALDTTDALNTIHLV